MVFSSLTSLVSKLERIAVKARLDNDIYAMAEAHKSFAAISVASCSDSARARGIGRRETKRHTPSIVGLLRAQSQQFRHPYYKFRP